MIFLGCTVQFLHGYTLHRYACSLDYLKQFTCQITSQIPTDENLFNILTCLDGFQYGTDAENHFLFRTLACIL